MSLSRQIRNGHAGRRFGRQYDRPRDCNQNCFLKKVLGTCRLNSTRTARPEREAKTNFTFLPPGTVTSFTLLTAIFKPFLSSCPLATCLFSQQSMTVSTVPSALVSYSLLVFSYNKPCLVLHVSLANRGLAYPC